MVTVLDALSTLRKCLLNGENSLIAEGCVTNIFGYFEEELSNNERDAALAALFEEKNGILPLMQKAIPLKKFSNVIVEGLGLIKYLVHHFKEYISPFVKNVKDVCVSFISHFDTSSKVKEKACDAVNEIVISGSWGQELNINVLIKELLNKASESVKYRITPTVRQKLFIILGSIARFYPEYMTSDADVLFRVMCYELENVKNKRNTSAVGCLEGLAEFLHTFSHLIEDSETNRRNVYKFVKYCTNYESDRNVIQRAALKILQLHGFLFRQYLFEDYLWWHSELSNKWVFSNNSEDRQMGRSALQTFYSATSSIIHDRTDEEAQEVMKYFIGHFRKSLMSSNIYSKEDAINGLGKFSQSCFKHITNSNMLSLFTLLMQQAQQLYLTVEEISVNTHKSLQMLPHFVKCIANIIEHLEYLDPNLSSLQHMAVVLIQLYTVTPVKFNSCIVDALITLMHSLITKRGLIFDDFISTVVYQGLIRTSSTNQNEELVSLWCHMCNISCYTIAGVSLGVKQGIVNKVYDTSLKVTIRLINRLDLRVFSKSDHIFISEQDPNFGLEAKNPNDFKIFINLVDFTVSWLPRAESENFRKWVEQFTLCMIVGSYKNPLVSGFYKILKVCFHICEKISFFDQEDKVTNNDKPIYHTICKHLQHVLLNLKSQRGDLQVSCIRLLLETPLAILPTILQSSVEILQVAFRVGHSYLKLASEALATLHKWKSSLSSEDIQAILPELEPFLQNKGSGLGMEKELEQLQSQGRKSRRRFSLARKKLVELPESELFELQQSILYFLGPLDDSTSISVLNIPDNHSLSWGHTKKLKFRMPFKDMNIFIYLDNLLPHVINLSLNCTERHTRIVACELLHAIIIFMLGTCKQMTVVDQNETSEIFEKIFLPLLHLGSDSDDVVHQLFNPLVYQLAHWYSSSFQLGSKSTEIFVNTVMNGIAHSSDVSLRDISAKCLHEFVDWSIKQHSSGKLEKSSFNIQVIIKQICMLCTHPSASKRLGGALAFNSVYTVLREDATVVNELFLELLYFMVQNLSLSKPSITAGVKNEAEQAVDHVLRVLKEKAQMFNTSNKQRRKPREFEGDKLIDAVKWLLSQCNSEHKDCRRKCMEIICVLAPCIENCDSSSVFIDRFVKEEGIEKLLKIIERSSLKSHDEPLALKSCDIEKSPVHVMHWLLHIISVLDIYMWLLSNSSVGLLLISHSQSQLIQCIRTYIVMCTRENFDLDYLINQSSIGPEEYDVYNEAKSTVATYLFKFLSRVIKCSENTNIFQFISEDFFDSSLWKLLSKCIFQSPAFGFDSRDDERAMELCSTLKTFLLDVQIPLKRINAIGKMIEILEIDFQSHVSSLKHNLKEILVNCHIPHPFVSAVKGMILIQECDLYSTMGGEDGLENWFISILKESVVNVSPAAIKAVILEPTAQSFGNHILKFACFKTKQVKLLVTLLLDPTILHFDDGTSLQHGEHFQATFRESILLSLLHSVEETIKMLLEGATTFNLNNRVLSLLGHLCQYAVENKNTCNFMYQQLHTSLLKYWPILQDWASLSSENTDSVLVVLKFIVLIAYDKHGCLVNHVAGKWILSLLCSQSASPTLKNALLDFLPCLIASSMQISNEVKEAFHVVVENFPKDTAELSKGSYQYNSFVASFDKILNILQRTGSLYMLERIIALTVSDENHICKVNIEKALPGFVNSLKFEEQCKAIEVGFVVFVDLSQYAPQMRKNCVRNFVVPLIRLCHLQAITQFFCKHVGEILRLLKDTSEFSRNIQIEHDLVSKIGCWWIVEVLFSVVSFGNPHPSTCSITEAAESHVEKTFVGDLSTLAYKSRFKSLPPNVKDDPNIKELFRKMKCAAYVSLSIIVSSTKKELRFFTTFLFKENKIKHEFLWENIVNCCVHYSFPIVWDQIPKQRKVLIGIRQTTQNELPYLATDTQILVNSTLAEDVSLFDFSTSIHQPPPKNQGNNSCMEVSLEDDELNQHECMGTICALLKHLKENEIYDVPKENGPRPEKLPSWMEEIRKSMMDETKHQNVRIFLTKVILNNANIFKPYASLWLYPLMQIVVNGCFGYEVNYMVMDVIALLVSWHEVAKPSTNETEKMLASQILEFLLLNSASQRRDIFKYNLDMVRTLVEVWKFNLSIPHQKLLDLLSVPSKTDITKGETGIHLASIFLANGIEPWNSLGKPVFIFSLASYMTSTDKLLCPSSEVIGMALKLMDPELNGNIGDEDSNIMNAIKQRISSLENSNDKYLHCLHCISRHYAPILDSFIRNIIYYLSKVNGKFKVMCLEMICIRIDVIEGTVFQELENRNLLSLLNHGDTDLQLCVLQLYLKMLPQLSQSKLQTVLDICINLSVIKSPACRTAILKILMWAYEKEEISEAGRSIFLKGLIDSDTSIQELLYNFWNDVRCISPNMPSRFLSLMSTVYSAQTEQDFLSCALLLLFDPRVFSAEYNSDMFQHPLSQCDFKLQQVILSDHKQRTSLAPLFSQPISTLATHHSFMPEFRIKSTQAETTLRFKPTIQDSSHSIPLTIGSSLFTIAPGTSQNYSYDSVFKTNKANTQESDVFKTRRLLKDVKQISNRHAYFAARREERRNELLQNRLKKREINVSLYRTYRTGDFPDVQIPFSSILKPLQALSKHNSAVARQLIISLFSSILQELRGEELSNFSCGIMQAFQNMMDKTNSAPILVGTVLEMILVCRKYVTLQTDVISSVSQASGLSMLGSLVLEEKIIAKLGLDEGHPTNSNEDENNCWLRIAELYQDLEEWDVVHGVFNEKIECCPAAKKGLKAESECDWIEAKSCYLEALSSDDPDIQKDNYYDAFFKCLARLSDWNQLHQCVLEQVDGDRNALWTDSWNKQHLLPHLFVCEINLMGSGDSNIFQKALECWLNDQEKSEYIQTHLTEELAVLYAIQKKFVKSQVYTRHCYIEFLNNWVNMSKLGFKERVTTLKDIHRFSELQIFLDFVKPSNKDRNPEKLMSCWRASVPIPLSSLLDWDKKLNYRKQFLKYLREEFSSFSKAWKNVEVEMQLAMVDAALAQNNVSVAEEYLKIPEERELPTKLLLLSKLGWSKCLWLKAHHKSRDEDKVEEMIKAVCTLYQNDPCRSNDWNEDWLLKLNACQWMSCMASGIWNMLNSRLEVYDHISEESKLHLLQWAGPSAENDSVLQIVHSCGLTYLHAAVQTAVEKERLTCRTSSSKFLSTVADAHFKIAEYYEKTNENVLEETNFVTYILRAMKYGSICAHNLFPRLLQSSYRNGEWIDKFIAESSEVAEWMFLKWINQILACLDKPIGTVLYQITVRVARAYPQALTWPYHISREKYNLSNFPMDILNELDSLLLQNTLTETFLKAMSCLAQPEVILLHHIEEILKVCVSGIELSDNVCKACNNLKTKIEQINSRNSIQGSVFHEMIIYGQQLQLALDLIYKQEERGIDVLKELKLQLEEKARNRPFQKMLLQKYSPWLSDFQLSYWDDYLELPGQYSGDCHPHPQHHVRVAGFSQEVQIIRSLRLPVKLIIIGNNGKEYPFLIKYGEDLRQDQRLQQLFSVMNAIFSKDSACVHRQLSINTYQVIPLTCQIGMIQWIENTKTLKSILTSELNVKERKNYERTFQLYLTWLNFDSTCSEDKIVLHRNAYKHYSRLDTIEAYEQRVKLIPWDIFRRAFMHSSKSPEEFCLRRQKFACSYASMCISHWVLGIGDRHLENCLIRESDGSAVGIDFGYAFGCGIQFIPIPELMPFRLTPHIINLMQPYENTGLIRGTMIHCLRALKKNSEILLATMEVFVHEPSINWIELAQRRYSEEVSEWLPQEKLRIAKKKLEGVNPVEIGSQELTSGHKTSKYLSEYLKLLKGVENYNIRAKTDRKLPVSEQVDCLVDLATDPHVLGKSWIGWEAWI